MKTVPFYSNSPDNTHCLQACVKSILSHYFPERSFTNEEVNEKTGGGWAWLPPAVVWLDDLGLMVKLYSIFNYEDFAEEGEEYLRRTWPPERFEQQKSHGAFKNLQLVQKGAQKLVNQKLWVNELLKPDKLVQLLENPNIFAIGKTFHEWLDGNYVTKTDHYVVVIKEYSPQQWRVHDPGLPPRENRKVPKIINNHSIFRDVLLLEGKK